MKKPKYPYRIVILMPYLLFPQ